jgi:sporulation protein YlmC with PRC-barrel domain
VEGTDVYNADGEHLGAVDDVMIDKSSGKAIHAIMSFGRSSALARSTIPSRGRR